MVEPERREVFAVVLKAVCVHVSTAGAAHGLPGHPAALLHAACPPFAACSHCLHRQARALVPVAAKVALPYPGHTQGGCGFVWLGFVSCGSAGSRVGRPRGGWEPKSRQRQGWHAGTVPCSQMGAMAKLSCVAGEGEHGQGDLSTHCHAGQEEEEEGKVEGRWGELLGNS